MDRGWRRRMGISPSWSNWTAFAEYNYYGFGNGPNFAQFDPRNFISAKQNIQTVKVGLNYKLFSP
jgi:opacity protein-like surface antigen